jgi:hypothetical protein
MQKICMGLKLVECGAAHHLIEVWAATRIHLMIRVESEGPFRSLRPEVYEIVRFFRACACVVYVSEVDRVVRVSGWE